MLHKYKSRFIFSVAEESFAVVDSFVHASNKVVINDCDVIVLVDYIANLFDKVDDASTDNFARLPALLLCS